MYWTPQILLLNTQVFLRSMEVIAQAMNMFLNIHRKDKDRPDLQNMTCQ